MIIFLVLLWAFDVSSIEPSLENSFKTKVKATGEVCQAIKDTIKDGYNPKEITTVAIRLNYRVCTVVKCAIDAGASVEQVILGATEAGAPAEVVTRCALDAGVTPETIARIIERAGLPGLGFVPPAGPGPATITVGLPGGGSGGGYISPSGF